MAAYVVEVTEDNLRTVILSEAGPNFTLTEGLKWLEDHGEGWFLRDEGTVLDCQFFVTNVLKQFYYFANPNDQSLFRRVLPV